MFRFLHTADIHLDSPLKGLEVYEDAPVDEIRGATRRAFDNLVDLAIEDPATMAQDTATVSVTAEAILLGQTLSDSVTLTIVPP